jgi:hypothetical protein
MTETSANNCAVFVPAHTPGPWEWANDEVFAEPSNDSICVVLQKESHFEANARLIAAAPDLLAAALEVRRCGNGGAKLSRKASDAIRTAIAKATGATP